MLGSRERKAHFTEEKTEVVLIFKTKSRLNRSSGIQTYLVPLPSPRSLFF